MTPAQKKAVKVYQEKHREKLNTYAQLISLSSERKAQKKYLNNNKLKHEIYNSLNYLTKKEN